MTMRMCLRSRHWTGMWSISFVLTTQLLLMFMFSVSSFQRGFSTSSSKIVSSSYFLHPTSIENAKQTRRSNLRPSSRTFTSSSSHHPFSNTFPTITQLHESPSSSSSENTSWQNKIIETISKDPKRSLLFSLSQTTTGALLGPLLDSYHSAFGVLQYDQPFMRQLWSPTDVPALITTWWVPPLFGLAGFIIGWLYILLDAIFNKTNDMSLNASASDTKSPPLGYSPPVILVGIAFFTFQYWLSGILYSSGVDREIILFIMSICACFGFVSLDNTKSGLITSIATAFGGPLIEVGLITTLAGTTGGYHYMDSGEIGFFPLWIIPVYFLGGPSNGNLARGVWNALGGSSISNSDQIIKERQNCTSCNDTRAVPCPNCDGVGYYMTYGREVKCNCCKGRGLVICRNCFDTYGEDPSDIDSIREFMSRLPD